MKGFDNEMYRQAMAMQKKLLKLQEELAERVVEGTAGGNMVRALVNGQKELVKIEIQPEVVDPDDVEMLEDLIVAAINQAMEKAEEMRQKAMEKVTGGLNLGGFGGLEGLLG